MYASWSGVLKCITHNTDVTHPHLTLADQPVTISVVIEPASERKRWLGGFKNKKTGLEYVVTLLIVQFWEHSDDWPGVSDCSVVCVSVPEQCCGVCTSSAFRSSLRLLACVILSDQSTHVVLPVPLLLRTHGI